ncbi:MAG: hypothetical protein NC412_01570 [Roseburia sp.]|nr:hypothetical protein [Roseburia sp.]MCM1277946.1 hypothetical protein [Robinsoniella sp.]
MLGRGKRPRQNVTIGFEIETYEELKRIAAIENISFNQVVRNYCRQGIKGRLTADNSDEIVQIIREQLRDVMKPQVERLASLNAKACIQAYTSSLLCAETINRLVPPEKQEDVVEIYERAKKQGVRIMRTDRIAPDEE